MSKSPFRAAPRPHGRRRAFDHSSPLARIAASSGAKSGSAFDKLGHRSAVVALSLGLLAVAGGGAAATANVNGLARTSSVEASIPEASGDSIAQSIAASPTEQAALRADAAASKAAAEQAAADKAAAEKAAADQAAAAKAAADQASADQAAAAKAAADKAAADKAAADKAAAALAAQPVDDPAGAKAYAASRLAAFGWGQDQMSALETLWTKESGWRTTATNASSGAYGIVQSLPGSKMASVGADWQTNYRTQIDWGLNYIKSRYGSPANALAFHLANNWY
ncbi:hypothetical protein [Sinomonas flava]|uniref:Transglycosylase SLT domain-containing protein n=1 Tax=Sinomonas flava TaxID=496857 RepID=A0ABN3C163_9MICC